MSDLPVPYSDAPRELSLPDVQRSMAPHLPQGWTVIRCQPIHRTPRRSGAATEIGSHQALLVTLQYNHGNYEVSTVEIQADRIDNLAQAVAMLPPQGFIPGTRMEGHRDFIDPAGRTRRQLW